MEIAEVIERARVEAGLTQSELARRAGTSQSAISAYESGKKSPSTSTLERLLAAAGRRPIVTLAVRPSADLSGPVGRQVRSLSRELRLTLARHGATKVRIFGSVARGQDTSASDLDLLVEMPVGTTLVDLARLVGELRELFGRRVDVLTPGALDDQFAAEIERESVPL